LLIVEDDHACSLNLKRIAETMRFDVHIAHSLAEAMDTINDDKNPLPDVMILDWHLNGGSLRADLVLDRWVAHLSGPTCVLSDVLDTRVTQDLIVRGAWNALQRPLPPDVAQAVLMRYGKAVLERKAREEMSAKLATLEQTIHKLKLAVISLCFVVAAVGGVEALPWLGKVLPFL
jgi:DNA-binding response OmpR family regulator